jgi:hypothetical protein
MTFLFATELGIPHIGNNNYMLAIGPNPGLGLSPDPIWKHSYETLDRLCEVIDKCEALKGSDVEALRRALDNGDQFTTPISEEKARCMGFKV